MKSKGFFDIKMTNSLRLTHHVLFCARLHVSVLRPFCESSLKNAGYILGSQLLILKFLYWLMHLA